MWSHIYIFLSTNMTFMYYFFFSFFGAIISFRYTCHFAVSYEYVNAFFSLSLVVDRLSGYSYCYILILYLSRSWCSVMIYIGLLVHIHNTCMYMYIYHISSLIGVYIYEHICLIYFEFISSYIYNLETKEHQIFHTLWFWQDYFSHKKLENLKKFHFLHIPPKIIM